MLGKNQRQAFTKVLIMVAIVALVLTLSLSAGGPEGKVQVFGKTYGEWGNSAIEAAALGKIVITNSLTQDLYEKEFGDCALHIANEPERLESMLKYFLHLGDDLIYQKKQETRAWVEDTHSMKATAKRLWEKVYKDLI